MIALGYIRRSKESGVRTVSLEDQRARIECYCQERRWSLGEVLADDGVSGGRRVVLLGAAADAWRSPVHAGARKYVAPSSDGRSGL